MLAYIEKWRGCYEKKNVFINIRIDTDYHDFVFVQREIEARARLAARHSRTPGIIRRKSQRLRRL